MTIFELDINLIASFTFRTDLMLIFAMFQNLMNIFYFNGNFCFGSKSNDDHCDDHFGPNLWAIFALALNLMSIFALSLNLMDIFAFNGDLYVGFKSKNDLSLR